MIKMVRGRQEDLTRMLSTDAYLKDMTLLFVDPGGQPDPVYLLDRYGNPIQEWPYIPSIGEVDDASKASR